MNECNELEPLVTRWVDGETDTAGAARVEAHLAACRRCAARAAAERTARRLLKDRHDALTSATVPPALRARLATLRPATGRRPAPGARTWFRLPVAIAATLLLAASGVTLHVLTGRSTTVLAAQLAADHVKCHLTEHEESGLEPVAVQDRLAARYGLHAQVPPGTADHRLRLVGARRCLTGNGTTAHILYRYDDQPVSLYLVPDEGRAAASVEVFGRQTYMWSRHNGTYVLVANAGVAGLPQLVAYMQQATR